MLVLIIRLSINNMVKKGLKNPKTFYFKQSHTLTYTKFGYMKIYVFVLLCIDININLQTDKIDNS